MKPKTPTKGGFVLEAPEKIAGRGSARGAFAKAASPGNRADALLRKFGDE